MSLAGIILYTFEKDFNKNNLSLFREIFYLSLGKNEEKSQATQKTNGFNQQFKEELVKYSKAALIFFKQHPDQWKQFQKEQSQIQLKQTIEEHNKAKYLFNLYGNEDQVFDWLSTIVKNVKQPAVNEPKNNNRKKR